MSNERIKKTLSVDIRAAVPDECDKVALLLKISGLVIHDIDSCLKGFWVAFDGERLAGTVGIENYGKLGLLRSLAVAEDYRTQGIGQHLYDRAIRSAQEQDIKTLYLLTTTAEKYFEKRGFHPVARETVPQAIGQTEQFAHTCPDSAAVMKLEL